MASQLGRNHVKTGRKGRLEKVTESFLKKEEVVMNISTLSVPEDPASLGGGTGSKFELISYTAPFCTSVSYSVK